MCSRYFTFINLKVCIYVVLTLNMSKSFWGYSVHFSLNWAVTRKTAHRRAKQMKIGMSWVYVVCIRVILTLNMSVLILGLFGALFSNSVITRERLIVEQNGRKFGPFACMWYTYGYFWPWRCQGHFVVIWCTFLKLGHDGDDDTTSIITTGTALPLLLLLLLYYCSFCCCCYCCYYY